MSSAAKLNPATKARIFAKTFNRCAYCGKKVDFETDYSVDHAVPECYGGPTEINNLFLCCKDCNQIKDNMNVEQFRAFLEKKASDQMSANMLYRVIRKFGLVEEKNKKIEFFFEKLKKIDADKAIDEAICKIEDSNDEQDIKLKEGLETAKDGRTLFVLSPLSNKEK